ncbi:MAG TPA: hypothetical protein VH414_01060 [Lichenihabitans sp.]|jgi:hypothetical protein|nr:hypothetical protein [Lichenihabitans sp.]
MVTETMFEPESQEDARAIASPTRRTVAEGVTAADDPAIVDPAEHTIVFTNLVTSDKDIVGLVAYSIYKQNKYDWLSAFGRQTGRMPDEAEAQAYLLGESTPRRLATYRHLAEATLEGRGVEVAGGGRSSAAARAFGFGAPSEAAPGAPRMNRTLLVGIIVAILVVIGLIWAFHGGTTPAAKP